MALDDEHTLDSVTPPREDRNRYDALPVDADDPLAIERLLDVPEAERRKRNQGFDPLETLPSQYRSEETIPPTRPDDEHGIDEGEAYLDTWTFHIRTEGGMEPVHHYVIHHTYRDEQDTDVRMRPLEYCSDTYLAIQEGMDVV